jgi:protein-S-isoprenylcysteine O-methyltransferase Ste14
VTNANTPALPVIKNVLKTTAFLIVFWSIFLFALPMAISIAEIEAGLQRVPSQPLLASALLLLATLLTLWSALTFAVAGLGTPLTIDPPREFVISGPYAYVRHPFVIGVVGQIVALGIALGSMPVIGYAAGVLIVWYYGVRPGEERALVDRFGDQARVYFQHVRGFRPRLTPYRSTRSTSGT